MIKYKVDLQKSTIQKENEQGVITRAPRYYPKVISTGSTDTRGMVKGFDAFGSSAFTNGEITGILEDLGSAIAYMILQGYNVHLNGLGTFRPTIKSSQSNVTSQDKINSSYFTCVPEFTADSEFKDLFKYADWQRVNESAASSTTGNALSLTFVQQSNESSLKFAIAPQAAGLAATTANVTAVTINGTAHNNYTVANGYIYLENAISLGGSLTDATVIITMSNVTVGDGQDAVVYTGGAMTVRGVSQNGPVEGGSGNMEG